MIIKKYTNNFTVAEMACPCDHCQGFEIAKMDMGFMLRLQKLRDLMAAPLVITSGYRCLAHNQSIGGSPRSYHLLGRACDISLAEGHIRGSQATFRAEIIRYGLTAGMNGFGIAPNFIHVDDRAFGKSRCWLY